MTTKKLPMTVPELPAVRRVQRLRATEIFGWLIGIVTLLYLMFIPLVPVITGKEIPCSSRFPLIAALAVGCALASGVIGGTATAKGSIPWLSPTKPLAIGATGGAAVLIIVFLLGWKFYVKDCTDTKLPQHPHEVVLVIQPNATLGRVITVFKRLGNVSVDTTGCTAAMLSKHVEPGEIRADGPRAWLDKLSYRVDGPTQAFSITEVKPEEKYALHCN